jgi:hypothetical protein
VTAISLTSVIGVSFVPLMSKSFYNNLLSSLIGLAVGSLSGELNRKKIVIKSIENIQNKELNLCYHKKKYP